MYISCTAQKSSRAERAFGEHNRPQACSRLTRVYQGNCILGDSAQCIRVGLLYAEGKKIERNDELAAFAFDRACRLGNRNGCLQAAARYIVHDMRYNDPAPLLSAVKMSCENDHAPSCFLLAVAYEKGSGVERNVARAKSLYEWACTVGGTRACAALERLAESEVGATPN